MKLKKSFLAACFAVMVLLPCLSQARYLNTANGRFQTRDLFEGDQQDPQSLHKYAYGEGDPVNKADPSGYLAEESLIVTTIQTQLRSTPAAATVTAGRSAAWKLAQSAALTAFLADSWGVFDENLQTDLDTLKRKNPDYMVFVHATSTGGWPALSGGGLPVIDPKAGGGDFGDGFYTFNASSADPRVIPTALEWANNVAGWRGGEPIITFWLIKRVQYNSLSKADFSVLPPVQYSQLVESFQDGITHTTGKDVAFGEIATRQGGTWVRNLSKPFQYKFETLSAVQGLKFFGGFSPQPFH